MLLPNPSGKDKLEQLVHYRLLTQGKYTVLSFLFLTYIKLDTGHLKSSSYLKLLLKKKKKNMLEIRRSF